MFNTNDYNNFSQENIKLNDASTTGSTNGWVNGTSVADSLYTPINAENLNAMLDMLIAIRNLIGTTDDFAEPRLNSVEISKPTLEGTSLISVADYLNALYSAIVTGDTTIEFPTNYSLAALKNYIQSLDVTDASAESDKKGDSKWLSEITQTDGKIAVEYSQPKISDIASDYSNANNSSITGDSLTDIIDALIGKINDEITRLEEQLDSIASISIASITIEQIQKLFYLTS